MQARRKTLLSQVTTPWIKNETGEEGFGFPTSCFDSAEIGELVGTYIQSKLANIINKEDVI